MELKSLVRDVAAIEEGRWVDNAEVADLGDLRLKVRGSHTEFFRKAIAEKERAGLDRGLAYQAMVESYCLLDIEGLTNGGKPVTLDQLRPMMADDVGGRLEPLRLLFLEAVRAVDATREAREIELSKN